MSDISDVVDVTIDATQNSITKDGFGTPLIVSHTAAWTERVRTYSSITAVGVDFATTTPEYKQAAAVFGAKNRPPTLKIGRADNLKPTQRWAVTPTAVNNYTYSITVGTTKVTYLSDGSATLQEIIDGLKAAIDALVVAVTTSNQGPNTYLRVVANVAGAWFSLETDDVNLSIVQDHADPGVATSLAAILLEDSDWYCLLTHFNSYAYVAAAAAWANPIQKLYVVQTQDKPVISTAISGTDDIGELLKSLDYDHVALIYSKATLDFADAAWAGRCLPIDPGTETWKFKSLTGVRVGVYTGTQRTNMRAKWVNFYENTKGQPMTEEGYTVGGDFIDFIRWQDYARSNIGVAIFTPLVEEERIEFNDDGIAKVNNVLRGFLQQEAKRKAINKGWTTTVPALSDISSADKTARLLDGVIGECVYSGAIHKVKVKLKVTV